MVGLALAIPKPPTVYPAGSIEDLRAALDHPDPGAAQVIVAVGALASVDALDDATQRHELERVDRWIDRTWSRSAHAQLALLAVEVAGRHVGVGDIDAARATLRGVVERLDRGSSFWVDAAHYLVSIRMAVGDWEGAQSLHGEVGGLELSAENATWHWIMGTDLAIQLGQLDRATVELKAAESALASIDSDEARSFNHAMLCLTKTDLLLAKGEFERLLEEVAVYESESVFDAGVAARIRGFAHYGRGDFEAAERELLIVIEPPIELLAPDFAVKMLLKLVDCQIQLGRLDEARAHADMARGEFGPLPATDRAVLTALEVEIALRSDEGDLGALRQQLESDWSAILDGWSGVDSTRGGAGILHLDRRTLALVQLMRLDARLGEPERAFGRFVQMQAVAAGRDREIADRATAVADGAGVLAVVPAVFRSVVLVAQSTGVDVFETTPLGEIRRGVEMLWRTDEDEASRAARREGMRAVLSDEVLGLMENWSAFTFCENLLGPVPIEAGLVGDQLVGERWAVDHCGNLADLLEPRDPIPVQAVRGAMLASLSPSPDLGIESFSLEGRRGELELPGAGQSSLVLNATPGDVREAATRADVLHVLGHGCSTPSGMRVLALSDSPDHPDGLLRPGVFEGTPMPRLITLSACAIADGNRRLGDHPLAATVAGAMRRAGAGVVAVPITPVTLDAHLDLIRNYHDAVWSGVAPAEAMRRARVQARRDGVPLAETLVQVFGAGQSPAIR